MHKYTHETEGQSLTNENFIAADEKTTAQAAEGGTREATYFFITDGRKEGPISKKELLRLKEVKYLSASTLIWTESYGSDWKEFGKADDLRELGAPPPIPLRSVPMTWLVALILAPPMFMLADILISDTAPAFAEVSIFVYWIVNASLALLDERAVKQADRYETPRSLIVWALIFVPVYIFIRGRRTGLKLWPFLAYIVSFFVSVAATETLRGVVYLGMDLPKCDAPVSEAQIRTLYSQIPLAFGAEALTISNIEEVSVVGTTRRECKATVRDSRAQERDIKFIITEQGDQYYFEVNFMNF